MSTRGNIRKLFVSRAFNSLYSRSFFARVVPMWNSLPDSVVASPTKHLFMHSLSDHMLVKFLHGRTL